jgi:hypothetical protein
MNTDSASYFLSDRYENISNRYKNIKDASAKARLNRPRNDLPVRLSGHNRITFLPAGSIAIQTLLDPLSRLHRNFLRFRDDVEARFPDVASKVFWQPPGTFHYNLAILRRLRLGRISANEKTDILRAATPVIEWLKGRMPFCIEFRGLIVVVDGSIIAKGYPNDPTAIDIREEFSTSWVCGPARFISYDSWENSNEG